MGFVLGARSKKKLVGVKPELVRVVERAISISKVDFVVTCGLRTLDEQKKLFEQKATQTMASKHLTGDAVDLAAYVNGGIRWELNLYDDLADAMAQAARDEKVSLRWGAAWNIPDIRAWNDTMESAMMHYVDERRAQGKRPFIDGPHFELS